MFVQKKFYNRETNGETTFPSMQQNNSFLNSKISANQDKGEGY